MLGPRFELARTLARNAERPADLGERHLVLGQDPVMHDEAFSRVEAHERPVDGRSRLLVGLAPRDVRLDVDAFVDELVLERDAGPFERGCRERKVPGLETRHERPNLVHGDAEALRERGVLGLAIAEHRGQPRPLAA